MKARLIRILKWTALAIFVLSVVFVFLVAPLLLAHFITRAGTGPMDRGITSTPADSGVAFEEITFASDDGVMLQGWYLGGGDRGLSVACAHGLFRSRYELLERAVLLRQSGLNVLLFDLRRHGASGGERIGLGYKERLDLKGAVSYLAKRAPEDRLLLLGVSMGAAAALLAASEDPKVVAVVADSSFLSLEHTVRHHLRLFLGLPKFPLGDELVFFIERFAGFRAEDLDVEKAIGRMGARPILFIAGSEDHRMPVETQRRLHRASGSRRSRFITIQGANHGACFRTDPETYKRELMKFIDEVVDP